MKKEIEIFGTKYESMKKAVDAYGLDYKRFWDRLNRTACERYDLELLVSLQDLDGMKLAFIGLNSQARYEVPWHADYQTTRQVIEHERPDLLKLYDKSHPDGKWNPYKSESVLWERK